MQWKSCHLEITSWLVFHLRLRRTKGGNETLHLQNAIVWLPKDAVSLFEKSLDNSKTGMELSVKLRERWVLIYFLSSLISAHFPNVVIHFLSGPIVLQCFCPPKMMKKSRILKSQYCNLRLSQTLLPQSRESAFWRLKSRQTKREKGVNLQLFQGMSESFQMVADKWESREKHANSHLRSQVCSIQRRRLRLSVVRRNDRRCVFCFTNLSSPCSLLVPLISSHLSYLSNDWISGGGHARAVSKQCGRSILPGKVEAGVGISKGAKEMRRQYDR